MQLPPHTHPSASCMRASRAAISAFALWRETRRSRSLSPHPDPADPGLNDPDLTIQESAEDGRKSCGGVGRSVWLSLSCLVCRHSVLVSSSVSLCRGRETLPTLYFSQHG
jgi:hypothetical protein